MFEDLQVLGVTPETVARVEIFAAIEAPANMDVFERTEPITGTLTYGQVQVIRGALRASAGSAIALEQAHKGFSEMLGQDYEPTCEHGHGLERALGELLALEDILASAVAEVDAEGVDFLVPDSLPTDFDAS